MSIEEANAARFEKGMMNLTELEGELLEAIECWCLVMCDSTMDQGKCINCDSRMPILKAYGRQP